MPELTVANEVSMCDLFFGPVVYKLEINHSYMLQFLFVTVTESNKLEPLMSAGMELLLQEFPAIFLKNE